jgi:hypothetical protein
MFVLFIDIRAPKPFSSNHGRFKENPSSSPTCSGNMQQLQSDKGQDSSYSRQRVRRPRSLHHLETSQKHRDLGRL